MSGIAENVKRVLKEVPDYVEVVAAAKARTADEVLQAVDAGIRVIGENYIRDTRVAQSVVGHRAQWHFIGRIREHDVRLATLGLFDLIQSVASMSLAQRIDEKCSALGRRMPVLVEVNSGREPQKAGVLPETAEDLVRRIASLDNVQVLGLMTMGPLGPSEDLYRPCFAETRQLFNHVESLGIPRIVMRYLSMGTSDTYGVAIEEGANMVRIGTGLFGSR
ncbi:MAG: YggS family pyridoxal phosphate-dependent enzyme [Chloroflexi bacterium]|nr:YggS family pyridoxal phosphate-dependent enzyme [Chloroflexota bacterium]